MSHRAVVTFLRAVIGDGLGRPEDRIATTSPLHFDFALFDIGIALGAGATLVPIRREHVGSPRRMLELLRAARVTQIDGVPSIWRPILRHFPELLEGLDSLRTVVFAGEEFPLPELRRLQEMLPGVRVVNGYGATESMACSFTEVPHPLPPDQERLSIAAVHTGAEVTLIGPDGEIVDEPGVIGELYVRSPSLFSGYWGDPEATARVLVPDPVDARHGVRVLRTGDLAYRDGEGGLYFCGRVDSQVQIRGNRVELGEVEAVLARFPGVRTAVAAAVPRGTAGADQTLVAFVLADEPSDFDVRKARAFCEQEIPSYMVPKEIHPVADLPLTVNGKVDRDRLLRTLPAGGGQGATRSDKRLETLERGRK
jgi:acyl-coenzyme A synthetase/AMP-(fatty) acid ligase